MSNYQYTIKNIASIIKGNWIANKHSIVSTSIHFLLIDSRKIINPVSNTSLFFAIKGHRNDGHKYIEELYEKGIRNFVVSDLPKNNQRYSYANFIQVTDTLKALQQLCTFHRKQFDIPVVGITGSNGKTIVKEWLYQLLCRDKHIVRSPKSYNSQVGVPLSVWQMSKEHEMAIFEAGISMPDEMQYLQSILQPTIGILTHIGDAHDEYFRNKVEKIEEKCKLFQDAEVCVYRSDNEQLDKMINTLFPNKLLFTWSKTKKADLQITNIHSFTDKTELKGQYKKEKIHFAIPFMDEASVENAIHCCAVMLYLGYKNSIIAERMKMLHPVAMRLELLQGVHQCTIINDSYNSDIGSLHIALDVIHQQKQHDKTTVILSDILQSGKNDESLYREVAELLYKKNIQRFIGVGNAISHQEHQFNKILQTSFYPSTEKLMNELKTNGAKEFNNETILIKGARQFTFEQLSKILQQKLHNTVLEIDLNALVDNLNYFRSLLNPTTKIMAVVKAFSYGSGSYEIANALQFHHADYLAVAYADEGVELRKAGITTPILVMNPDEQSFHSIIKYQLEPEIYSLAQINKFFEMLSNSLFVEQYPFPIHIKLDTGMHRLGFEENQINELITFLKQQKNIIVRTVFTHLAASNESEHDSFTKNQIQLFDNISNKLIKELRYPILRHVLNSSGVQRFNDAQYDMVRLGIGLYGVSAVPNKQNKLKNISTLKTTISQIKMVKAGETIGYSRHGVAKKDIRIAVVSIGYADGLDRRLGLGKGKMWVNHHFAPIIGNVCMDMSMLDITHIPAKEGDEVIVFGTPYSINEMAKDTGTIPYEILTGISNRVKRVYYQE